MERIGDFAKRCQTTIKTLRYYGQLGLLIPDYIDNFTNYRYYGPGKIEEMRRITELKSIGFTLDEIKRYCAATIDEQTHIIEAKHLELMKLASDTAQQLKMLDEIKLNMHEGGNHMTINANNANAPFINDERAIGRWKFIATVSKKEDFKPHSEYNNAPNYGELFFLPQGEHYWGFSWTKGFIKIDFGDVLFVPYERQELDGKMYMFADHPNRGCWVLQQIDNHSYTKSEIGQWDDINLPFIDDPDVQGSWISVDFVQDISDFVPGEPKASYLWLKSIEFLAEGQLNETFGDETAFAIEQQKIMIQSSWTKDKLLQTRAGGSIAPAYTIQKINNVDYLFLEWKSGDVIWGRWKPQYYVLIRK